MSDQKKKRQNSSFRSSRSSGSTGSISGDGGGGGGFKSPKPVSDMSDCQRNKPKQTAQAKHSSGSDHFRKIVQAEGRTARNLVTWSVPLDSNDQTKVKPGKTNVQGTSPLRKTLRTESRQHRTQSDPRSASSPRTPRRQVPGADGGASKASGSRQTGPATKKDLRARYWAFLFENLRRAVDEIYQTCETDESVVECKEVIMILDQYTKDFKSLIERLQLMRAYENADEGSRPTSLAWEVRKSPGKLLSSGHGKDGFLPSPTVVRSLTFSGPGNSRAVQGSGSSWADRVRGVKTGATLTAASQATATGSQATVDQSVVTERKKDQANNPNNLNDDSVLQKPSESNDCNLQSVEAGEENKEDLEGWETVQRAGKVRMRPISACFAGLEDGSSAAAPEFKRSVSALADQTHRGGGCGLPLGTQSARSLSALNVITTFPSPPASVLDQKSSPVDSEKENRPLVISDAKTTIPILKLTPKAETLQRGNITPRTHADIPSQTSSPARKNDIFNDNLASESSPTARVSEALQTAAIADNYQNGSYCVRLSKRGAASSDEDADGEYEDEEEDINKELCKTIDEEEALKSAMEEERSYLDEIAREENLEIVIETEPETEAESEHGLGSSQGDYSAEAYAKQYEDDVERWKGMSWGDMVEMGEETESRIPGRVVHVHEKLSSPSRKRSTVESKRQHEEKQAKAQELREKLLQERGERMRVLTKKAEEIQAKKLDLLQQRRAAMERKLTRADEKRQLQLQKKVRKAHEEENKLNEIVFINTLEAQNKRHEIMSKYQESEARLQDLQEERQRKHEEKAAKEAAVEERRRALEADRQTRLQEIQERRQQRVSEFEQRQQEKEKERLEAARAKERDREERLAALNKQQQAHIEELQKKIQQKQDETDRRHKEKLEAIQEKAFRMSILHHSSEDMNDVPPKLVPYEKKKFCLVCNIMIPSEVYLLSHLRGKKHQQALSDSNGGNELSKQDIENFNLQHISDAPSDKPDPKIASEKERHKALKKRCKKLRFRLAQRGMDYEKSLIGKQYNVESENRTKLQKIIKDLQKCLQSQAIGPWPQNRISSCERSLGEIGRILEKKVKEDQVVFCVYGGVTALCDLLKIICQPSSELPPIVPAKTVVHACTILTKVCLGCYDNCQYLLLTNKIGFLIDLLVDHLNLLIPDNYSSLLLSSSGTGSMFKLPANPVTTALTEALAVVIATLSKTLPYAASVTASQSKASSTPSYGKSAASNDSILSQCNDVASYVISIGIVDKLALYFNNVRGPVDGDAMAAEFLQHCMELLTALIGLTFQRGGSGTFDKKKFDDPTQLIVTLKVTQLVGIVSLMYGMLLHADAPARGDNPPPPLPQHTLTISTMGFRMLNHIAQLDLQLLQSTLGDEGTSLEFRHISSYLLWYCHNCTNEELLHEVILCIGFFSVLNHDNQVIIQSGLSPTILQQLCALPFQYFSDVRLTAVLFPTLVSCCFLLQRNREILEQELSCALLANFVEEKILESQQTALSLSSANTKKAKSTIQGVDSRMLLASRFPEESWTAAQEYFSSTK